jgi:hypothetical protein
VVAGLHPAKTGRSRVSTPSLNLIAEHLTE